MFSVFHLAQSLYFNVTQCVDFFLDPTIQAQPFVLSLGADVSSNNHGGLSWEQPELLLPKTGWAFEVTSGPMSSTEQLVFVLTRYGKMRS